MHAARNWMYRSQRKNDVKVRLSSLYLENPTFEPLAIGHSFFNSKLECASKKCGSGDWRRWSLAVKWYSRNCINQRWYFLKPAITLQRLKVKNLFVLKGVDGILPMVLIAPNNRQSANSNSSSSNSRRQTFLKTAQDILLKKNLFSAWKILLFSPERWTKIKSIHHCGEKDSGKRWRKPRILKW